MKAAAKTAAKVKDPAQNSRNSFMKTVRKHWMLLLMLAPASIYVIIFSYIPMTGLVLAFKQYNYKGGIYMSPWNGLANFKALMMAGKMGAATRNTLLYNIAFIFLGLIFEVGSAILLNELHNKYFKKISQSLMFLPYFVSWVVAGAIMYNIFNYEKGVFNNVVTGLGGTAFDLYNTPGAWPFVLIFLRLDQEMYEAASIDGANEWQKIRHLTLPCLKPTMIIMVLLAIGNIFRGDFGLFYQTVKSTALLQPVTDIIDTYIFRLLINSGNVGVSSACGFLQSILCFVTIMICNKLVKTVEPDYALY